MNNPDYSTALKPFYSIVLSIFPGIIGLLLLYYFFYGEIKDFYLSLLTFWAWMLSSVQYYKIPKGISLYGSKLSLKPLFGKEITLDLKKIWSIEIKYCILIIKAGKDRFYTLNAFSGIESILDNIKRFAPEIKILRT